MLYERWREVALANADQIAVNDLAQDRACTFRALLAASDTAVPSRRPVAFPQGAGIEFIFQVLMAWRTATPVCPLEAGQAAPAFVAELPPGIVHLKMTSATTGPPKFVAFTAHQLAADAANIVATMGLRSCWPNLGIISLAHSYGFSNLVLPLLLHGIPLVLARSNLPESLGRAAQTQPDLTLAAVPALWRAWHEAQAIPENIRLAISAGAPLPLALEQSVYAASGLKIHNFYGSSECGGIAYDSTDTPRPDGSCVGAPMHHVDVRLAEDGCVEVRGAAVGETYWPAPAESLCGGVFRSADLGKFQDGILHLRGRRGDQINVAGRKVAPELVEGVLASCPGVRACLAFGVPGEEQRGETIVACIEAAATVTREILRHHALARLQAWQVPREWWFLDHLEPNERGKLSRAEWRARYLQRNP